MPLRTKQITETTNFTGGINMNDASRSTNQVADARNVWCPDGKLKKRPGVNGEWCLPAVPYHNNLGDFALPVRRAYTEVGGVFTREITGILSLAGFIVGNRWYLGFPSIVNRTFLHSIDVVGNFLGNTNISSVLSEYWDGVAWKSLPTSIVWNRNGYKDALTNSGGNPMSGEVSPYMGGVNQLGGTYRAMTPSTAVTTSYEFYQLTWPAPNDWAQNTLTDGVDTDTFYWLRFTLLDNNFSAGVPQFYYDYWTFGDPDVYASWGIATANNKSIGFVRGVLNGVTVYINFYRQLDITSLMIADASKSHLFMDVRTTPSKYTGERNSSFKSPLTNGNASEGYFFEGADLAKFRSTLLPITVCNFTEMGSLYFCLGGYIFEVQQHLKVTTSSVGGGFIPDREMNDLGVKLWDINENFSVSSGPGAPWDADAIAQLADLNSCDIRFIAACNGRMWMVDGDYTIRWSAGIPYQNVWPLLAVEYITGDDNSAISAIYGLGETLTIFKKDSIWIMPYVSTDQFGITHYIPRKAVSGTGCVSQGSVQGLDGRLIFLGEDGLYLFDGTNIVSIDKDPRTSTSRLGDIFKKMSPSTKTQVSSILWRDKHCYLLAIPYNGAETNNIVIVWDYKTNALWLWDMEVAHFTFDLDQSGKEMLYYVTHEFEIFSFGEHLYSDYGASINSWVLTRKFGFASEDTKVFRNIDIRGINFNEVISITPVQQSKSVVGKTSYNLNLTDTNENFDNRYVFGTPFDEQGSRQGHLSTRDTCNHIQYQISHEIKDAPFELDKVDVTYSVSG